MGSKKEVYINAKADGTAQCEIKDNLFFADEEGPELTEFEKAIKDLVLAIDEGELRELGVFEEENLGAWAVKKAAELLSLALKQLQPKIDAIILDTNNEFAVDYSNKISRQRFYEEVLKRFNEQRKK